MKKLVLLAICFCGTIAFAQKAPQEVTLVVSADGATKTQAIDNALRSAIEQTFGTFVSANTEILNDELVKDEIATVSSGNIQKYSEIAAVTLPNGNTSVTINVTVSLAKLVSYAQSKGSECEFAGATFGANLRMYEFKKKNEKIAIENMIKQLNSLRPIFDYSISVSDPIINDPNWPMEDRNHGEFDKSKYATIKISVKCIENQITKQFLTILNNTFSSLAKTIDEIGPLQKSGFKFYKYNVGYLINPLPDDLYYLLDIVKYDFIIEDNNNTKYLVYGKTNWINDYVDIHWPDWFKGDEEAKYERRKNVDITSVSPCSWNNYDRGQTKRDCNSNTVLHNVPFIVPLNDIQTITQIRVTPTLEQRSPYIFIRKTNYTMDAHINEPFLILSFYEATHMSIYRNCKSIQPDFERFLDDELKKSTIPILTEKQLKYADSYLKNCYGFYSWPDE